MPHLSPMLWLTIPLMFFFLLLLLSSMFWWHQFMNISFPKNFSSVKLSTWAWN